MYQKNASLDFLYNMSENFLILREIRRSQWRCCGSAAARLLRLWVRMPPEGMDVCLL